MPFGSVRVLALVLLAGAAACRPTSRSTQRADAPVGDAAACLVVTPRDGAAPAPPAAPEAVGLAPRPGTSDAAARANEEAFKAHRSGDYATSRAGFARAVALDPDFTMARFNLACAAAREGFLDDAERELGRALREDLPTYRRGLERDPDLAALRESGPHAGRLRALVAALEVAYAAALARGLRAIQWKASSPDRWGTNHEQRTVAQPSVLRLGAFDPATGRFVPIAPAPPAGRALTALWNRAGTYGAVITGAWTRECPGDLCQLVEGVGADVYDLSLSGEPVAKMARSGSAISASAAWSSSGFVLDVALGMEQRLADNGDWISTFSPGPGAKPVTKHVPFSEHDPPKGPPSEAEAHLIGPTGVNTGHDSGGMSWDPKARTLKLTATGETVPVADPPSKVHAPRPVLAPGGRRALLVWDETAPCVELRPEMHAKEAVLSVDFDAKSVTKVAETDGRADAAFDGSGRPYVQTDKTLAALLPTAALDPLPAGVLLSPPTVHSWSCVGFW